MSSNYYHKSYSDAIQTAMLDVKKRGFEVDQDDYDRQVTFGKGKPSEGKTAIHSIRLTKNGKAIKKTLEVQVYNRGGNTPYERNHYIGEEMCVVGFKEFNENTHTKDFVKDMKKGSAQDLRTKHGKKWKDVMSAIANHRHAQQKTYLESVTDDE